MTSVFVPEPDFDDACVEVGVTVLAMLADGCESVRVTRNDDGTGWDVDGYMPGGAE